MRKTHGSRIGELEVERYEGGARNLIEGVGIHLAEMLVRECFVRVRGGMFEHSAIPQHATEKK